MIVTEYTAASGLRRVQGIALLAALAGIALLLAGALLTESGAAQFWRSYFLGWSFWTGIALGALGVLMIQHVSGGIWGMTLRRPLEAAVFTIPVMGILFIPVLLFGLYDLYEWSHPGFMVGDVLGQKGQYLNVPFFSIRMVLYFVIWTALAFVLRRLSARQDATGDTRLAGRMTGIAAPGLVLYAVTMTLFSVDLLLSLDAEFYSTIWGALVTLTFILAAFAFMIITATLLTERGPLHDVLRDAHFLDVGKLLLAFVILWTYMALSQLIIIYSGNLPLEAAWYVDRARNGYEWFALALVVFGFLMPFLLLLSRDLKRRPRMLVWVAALAFVMQYVYLIWLAVPNWHPDGLSLSLLDLIAPVAFGGIFLLVFAAALRSRPLLPLHVMPERHPRARKELLHAGQ